MVPESGAGERQPVIQDSEGASAFTTHGLSAYAPPVGCCGRWHGERSSLHYRISSKREEGRCGGCVMDSSAAENEPQIATFKRVGSRLV